MLREGESRGGSVCWELWGRGALPFYCSVWQAAFSDLIFFLPILLHSLTKSIFFLNLIVEYFCLDTHEEGVPCRFIALFHKEYFL